MDTDFDPCDDFFKYACNGYIKNIVSDQSESIVSEIINNNRIKMISKFSYCLES